MKPRLFIDTDMGVDDIAAIAMLVASGRYDIVGVSIVNGVSSIRQGWENAVNMLRYVGLPDVPVYAGASARRQSGSVRFPARDRRRAETLAAFPAIPRIRTERTVPPWKECIRALGSEEAVTLMCLGPLTNVAVLLNDCAARRAIGRLVVMGGAFWVPGNVGPGRYAEYNIALDPKAAAAVFASGKPITVIPMDACLGVPACVRTATGSTRLAYGRFRSIADRLTPSSYAAGLVQSAVVKNDDDVDYLYDPLVTAIAIDPSIVMTTATGGAITVVSDGPQQGRTSYHRGGVANGTTTIVRTASTAKAYTVILSAMRPGTEDKGELL